MQKHQAIFVIGSPGSGKDVLIRDISSNYNITEFSSAQIDEMLSDDISFKRAKVEKRDALLENNSILVTANSFDLNFVVTKYVLESVGYTSHLIFVEANLQVSYDRLSKRTNLKESLDKLSLGNNNKSFILEFFESKILVDNSAQLDLEPSREFVSNILDELSFQSDLTLEKVMKVKFADKAKHVVSGSVPGRSAIVLPIIDDVQYKNKSKKNVQSKVPCSDTDATGEQMTGWTSHMESIDEPSYCMFAANSDPMSSPITTKSMDSDTGKKDSVKRLLGKLKTIKMEVPSGI